MDFQSNEQIKTYTGSYDSVHLGFTPDGPPLSEAEKSKRGANYPTRMAFLHVYLGGEDAASQVPSGHLFSILLGLLQDLPDLLSGKSIKVNWLSDPWQLDIRGDPTRNCAYITLHVPNRWVSIDAARVPLDILGEEVVRIAQKWKGYLLKFYEDEMLNLQLGEPYQEFKSALRQAAIAMRSYIP